MERILVGGMLVGGLHHRSIHCFSIHVVDTHVANSVDRVQGADDDEQARLLSSTPPGDRRQTSLSLNVRIVSDSRCS